MPGKERINHAILIISASEQFSAVVKQSLPEWCFTGIDVRKTGTTARRCVLERYYDIVVINVPLPDEQGIDLALDIAAKSNASVLVAVPAEEYEDVMDRVTDDGILALSKPMPRGRIGKALRLLVAIRNKMHALEQEAAQVREKMEEMRIINKAKFLLMEQQKYTEEEAHRFIGKQAMNHGVSRKRIAQRILDDLE